MNFARNLLRGALSNMASSSTANPSVQIQPLKVGNMNLLHRVVMSPMTRLRNEPGVEAPREMNFKYYEQRSTQGGLLITEGVYPVPSHRGYVRAPGLHSEAQLAAMRSLAQRVHAKGAFVFCQLMHPGRVSHSSLLGGQPPLAPSPLKASGQMYVESGVKEDYSTPRAMTEEDIRRVVGEFAEAAKRAVDCGFDGIELHGGNGYLIQQFLALKTNQRGDQYGGSVENRARLLLELVDACGAAIGPARVAVKLQPGVTFSDLIEAEEDVLAQLAYLGPQLGRRGLAYVCLSSLNGEPYYKFAGLPQPNLATDVFRAFRPLYSGTLMINGGLAVEVGEQYRREGVADLVCYGAPFISNANLPDLIAAGFKTVDLNPGGFNPATWYSKDPAKDEVNYIDWPLVEPVSKW